MVIWGKCLQSSKPISIPALYIGVCDILPEKARRGLRADGPGDGTGQEFCHRKESLDLVNVTTNPSDVVAGELVVVVGAHQAPQLAVFTHYYPRLHNRAHPEYPSRPYVVSLEDQLSNHNPSPGHPLCLFDGGHRYLSFIL